MAESVRIGLIGAGNISATHARAIGEVPGASVVAVYGPTRERAERLAATCGARADDALDRFFDGTPMDMVAIGTPSGLHGEHGAAAARRGLHVLVEKPIEITATRADVLIDAAARARVSLGVIFQDRLKADVRRLKALVDSGALGTTIVARAQVPWWRPPEYYSGSRWRGTWALDGGGALMNQGSHTVDLLLWLCGPVSRVCGRTATRFHTIEVEDTAVAAIEFASGVVGTLEATTAAYPGRPRRIEISGSKGTVILEGDRLIEPGPSGGGGSDSPENVASPVVSDASAHRDVFIDFIAAMKSGGSPCCDGREGRRSVALIEAVYESSRRGRPVELSGSLSGLRDGGWP
jgi:UDP-N-acetyl-2-amino-2-deoxyglucuronate dehydrogenase